MKVSTDIKESVLHKESINPKFKNSDFHHFHLFGNDSMGAYIPSHLHRIHHNPNNWDGMNGINFRAYNWLALEYCCEPLAEGERITKRCMNKLKKRIKSMESSTEMFCGILTEVEFEGIRTLKNASGLNWHDFILVSTGAVKKKDLKKK